MYLFAPLLLPPIVNLLTIGTSSHVDINFIDLTSPEEYKIKKCLIYIRLRRFY